ncbi:glutamate decarboxylase [Aspergillus terreus NIH2624]|uniref:Glutamate decarboxylase n=1 Tax=Aspergillus terreus (strain NIH 2624 / FGSC A1156) TaxID=341663 RepID=Q0CEV7_ASPTN|nr:glutamate decarboxylase [Aspergillus terreus NIH2624]EAU32039.1 glutamate decarboxylase [Aspergillus terreus NIH2624]
MEALTAQNMSNTMCGIHGRDISSITPTITSVFMGLGVAVTLMRCLQFRNQFGFEDVFALLALISAVAMGALEYPMARDGMGRDIWTVEFESITRIIMHVIDQNGISVSLPPHFPQRRASKSDLCADDTRDWLLSCLLLWYRIQLYTCLSFYDSITIVSILRLKVVVSFANTTNATYIGWGQPSVPEVPHPDAEVMKSPQYGRVSRDQLEQKMVHLSRVRKCSQPRHERRAAPAAGGSESPYVYASRYAAEELPEHTMAEREMPADVAYKMIKDELSLDGNPLLNLASFVTTYMEEPVERLMSDAMSKNFIDFEQYPQTAHIQNRCVNMIADLLHAPTSDDAAGDHDAIGTSTVGSSEAIMLAMLAMKKRWQNRRKAEGKDWTRPNIVMNSAVQVCWEKAARYFDVEEKYVYCTEERYVIDPKTAVDLVDENTVGICAIMGTTYTGQYEDVKAINDLLKEKKIDCPIHVDAASGGFVAPFVNPSLVWDFRLEKVVSINVSGHKYGLVYPGVGWVFWRAPEYLPKELIFNINYLGAEQASFTLNFSKGAQHVIGQYYQLIRLGKHGYKSIMMNLIKIGDYLSDELRKLGFIIMSDSGGRGLPLVAFRLQKDDDRLYDEFALAHVLRQRGWVIPAYTMAPHSNHLRMMRIVLREDFSLHRCNLLIEDVKMALKSLEDMDEEMIEKFMQYGYYPPFQ